MHLLAISAALLAVVAASAHKTRREIGEHQLEAAKRWQTSGSQSRGVERNGVQNITFTNPKASGE